MRSKWVPVVGIGLIALAGAAVFMVRRSTAGLPSAGSPTYEQTTASFYRGLAQLQVGLLDDAKREFAKATTLAPGEPAAWANLGLAHLRLGEFDAAAEPIERAVALRAGRSSDLAFLQGRLETSRGRIEPGIAHFRRAVDLDPAGLRARYALAEEIERAGGANADAEAQQLFEQILQRRPDNLAVDPRAGAPGGQAQRHGRAARLDGTPRRDVRRLAGAGPRTVPRRCSQAVDAGNFPDAARGVAFLRNVLVRVTVFRESLAARPNPDGADRGAVRPISQAAIAVAESLAAGHGPGVLPFGPADSRIVGRVRRDGDVSRRRRIADSDRGRWTGCSRRRHRGCASCRSLAPALRVPPTAHGVLAVDWNRDFKMDLALAGRGGRAAVRAAGRWNVCRCRRRRRGARSPPIAPASGRPISKWTAIST